MKVKFIFKKCEGKEKRVYNVKSFDEFLEKVKKHSKCEIEKYKFQYLDKDNDWITFDTKEEYDLIVGDSIRVRIFCKEKKICPTFGLPKCLKKCMKKEDHHHGKFGFGHGHGHHGKFGHGRGKWRMKRMKMKKKKFLLFAPLIGTIVSFTLFPEYGIMQGFFSGLLLCLGLFLHKKMSKFEGGPCEKGGPCGTKGHCGKIGGEGCPIRAFLDKVGLGVHFEKICKSFCKGKCDKGPCAKKCGPCGPKKGKCGPCGPKKCGPCGPKKGKCGPCGPKKGPCGKKKKE